MHQRKKEQLLFTVLGLTCNTTPQKDRYSNYYQITLANLYLCAAILGTAFSYFIVTGS